MPSLWRCLQRTPNRKRKTYFSISTRRLAESVEGVNSCMALVAGDFGPKKVRPIAAFKGLQLLSKYCKLLVSPICCEIFRFLCMFTNPKLAFDSTLYQLAAQVEKSANFAVHYKHLRPTLQLLNNFKLFSYYLTHMPNVPGLLLLD